MAKKQNAFYDKTAKKITKEDVEGLMKMEDEAKNRATIEANKADYKAPKYNSLPTLDDTSKKVSTKAPSVSPEQPKTMSVGNKTFKVADNAKKTSIDSGKKLANGKKDEQTEYYNKQIEKRNNLKRSESSLGNYGWEGTLKSIRNKQIAKTDRELASTYVNDKANEQEINNALAKWSNPNYKMSEFERKQAKAITKDYFKGSDKKATYRAKNGLGVDAKAKGLSAINFADDLANGNEERYNLMNQLAAKSNKASAVAMGGVDALGTNTLAKALNNAIGDEETAKTIAQMEQNVQGLKNQSPLAYNAGYMGTKMGEYAMLNQALSDIPELSKLGKVLNSGGGLTKDMLADLLLDTTFETAENAVNGESLGKVSADTAKNVGVNLVFNMLPELLGGALKSANPEMADDVVKNLSEALQKEEVKPDTSFVDFANELTNRDINVSPYMDNTQRATIDRLRAENPQLLGRLSDEDVLAFDRANTGADVLNQNYETLRNVMNNTDQPTRAIADNGGDIPSALDIMPNEASGNYKVIQDFRTQNPTLTQNMSDRDILNYLNTPKSAPRLERPIVNEVAEEVSKPTMTALDYDNAVRDLSERYSIANEVDDLIYDDLAKDVTFDNAADKRAFEEALKAFKEDSKNVMNASTTREVAENIDKIVKDSMVLDNTLAKGYAADKRLKKELQELKKNFYNDTKGTVIRLTPDLRHEMGLDGKTIAELNNELRLGKNGIRFSANNGTPIDMLFDELKQASGNIMRDADNSADQLNALMEYVESLKNGEAAKMRVGKNDLLDADFFDVLYENVAAYDDALARLGVRPEGEGLSNIVDITKGIDDVDDSIRYMAEDIGINPVTTMDEDIDIPEPNITSSMPKTVEMPDGTLKTETGEIKERGYSNSIRNKTNLPDDVKKEFPEYYEVLKNPDTEEEVNRVFASIPNTSDAVLETMRRIEQRDATAIPLGYKVSERLIAEGKHDQAVDLLKHMSEELTRSGQFTQAAAITLMHEDPMTALRYLQKQMDEINVEGAKRYKKKWHDLELTEDEIARMGELEKGDADGIKEVYNDVFKRLQKEYPSTTWEKFIELTKLGMLLNPRTHIRNTAANSLLLPVRSASDRVSAVGQLLSGAERTQSLVGGTKAQKKIAGEIYENEMKGLLEGDDKWSDLKGVARDKQVFGDSKVGWVAGEGLYRGLEGAEKLGNAISEMPLVDKLTRGKLSDALKGLAEEGKEGMTDSIIENLRRFDYYLLSKVEDDPFVKKNFTNRLASYMKAQNINNIDDIPMEAKQFAWEEALKATFKDDNKITSLLANIKKDTGKFGEVLLPFTKTPANLAARAIDYSPVGIAKAISDYYKTPLDARNVPKLWDDMSKGIVGSAGILLGYMLRKSGVITGALSDDKDTANFEKQTGKQAYSLHLGDKYYSYDWAQPAGTPMIIGANIYDAVNSEDTSEEGRLKTIGNGLYQGGKAAFDTWLQLSPLQNVGDLFNGNGNSGETTSDRFVQTITDMPQRLIPSLMGATARTVDPIMRETYDKNSLVNTWVNNAKAKIPAIGDEDNWWNTNVSSKSLPAKYDNWGNERTRSDSIKEAAFAQMVNPGQLSNNNSTPIDNEIGRLGELDAKAYPSTAGWSVKIGDNNVTLSNEQHSEYQKNLGEAQYQLAKTFVDSDYYNNFSDDEKTEILGNLYSFANALAKSEQFDYDIAGNSSYKKAYAEYQKGGLDAVADYYATKNVLSDVSEQFTKKNGEGKSFSDLSKEENLKVLTDMVNDGYMTKEEAYDFLPDNKMVETLSQYGNQGYELYADLVQHGTSDKGDFTNDKVIPVLRQANVDPKMAGEILYSMNGSSNATKVNKVYDDLGPEGLWDYYNYKEYANLDGENSITNKELTAYLDDRDYMSQDEKRYWFDVLKANKKTKNPY